MPQEQVDDRLVVAMAVGVFGPKVTSKAAWNHRTWRRHAVLRERTEDPPT